MGRNYGPIFRNLCTKVHPFEKASLGVIAVYSAVFRLTILHVYTFSQQPKCQPTLSQKSATVAENGDCRRRVRLLQKSATVAEKCDCRRKRRDNDDSRRIRRQSPNSATVALICNSRTYFSATVCTGFKEGIVYLLKLAIFCASELKFVINSCQCTGMCL